MLHPKTTLPSPALLASCWKAFGSVIYLFFSLGKWGKSAGLHSWPGDALQHQLSPVLGVRGPRRAEPGVSQVSLHSQDWCGNINGILIWWRRSPAACSTCGMISWSESLSHRPRCCLGLFPQFLFRPFLGQILALSPPVLQLGQLLQGLPGHTSHFCFSLEV